MEKITGNNEVDCLERTRGSAQVYRFKWILEDYSRITNYKNLESTRFYPEEVCAWWSRIYKSTTRFQLYLHRNGGHGDVEVECQLKVAIRNDKVWQNKFCTWNFGNSTMSEILINAELSLSDVKENANDIMEITILLNIYKMKTNQLTSSVQFIFPSDVEFQRNVRDSMLEDVEKLFETHINTDTTLSIKGQTLDVHKTILSSRSPVFAKMFQQEMAETTKNIVMIEDVKMSTMKEVVAFMYGKAKRDYDYDTAIELYYTADKYDIKKLKEICGSILATHLSEDNAGHILSLADQYHDKQLKEIAMKFITFRMESCVKTEWWNNLMSHRNKLTAELSAFIAVFK